MSEGALAGKTIVITGATSGIGLATSENLAKLGARLVLVGRDKLKGEAALQRLRSIAPDVVASLHYANLASLAEVRALGDELAALPRIDVLLNNAGAIFARRAETADGLERTFALNHMAYYVLTRRLIERLAASAPARIVNVASVAHRGATLDFDDLQMTRSFDGWTAYRRSKLCNILFTRDLARRIAGTGVTANALHPGFVASRFGDNNAGWIRAMLAIGKWITAISTEKGALTPTYLASSPDVAKTSGRYFSDSHEATPSAQAQDDRVAAALWRASAQIAGLPEELPSLP